MHVHLYVYFRLVQGRKQSNAFCRSETIEKPSNHSMDCYFCIINHSLFTRKYRSILEYPDISSFRAPVLHTLEHPVPIAPSVLQLQERGDSDTGDFDRASESSFDEKVQQRKPYFPCQSDINDLIRDLNLNKSQSELLTSRLKEWQLLGEDVLVTHQRKRH